MTAAEEQGFSGPTFYFRYRGEVNTGTTLELARERALKLDIKKMVVASETGRSALKALKVVKDTDIKLIVVTHYPDRTWGPKGDIPIGLDRTEYQHIKRYLKEHGAIVVQGTRPFAGVGRALGWNSPVPATFVDKTLELFSSGTKIAVEVALMATDTGILEDGETVVALGGTYKGLDTAVVVKTTYSGKVFTNFEVLELIAKPLHAGKRLPEYEQEGWKGDLDQYYEPIRVE
jgi:hypothetical protein